MNRQPKESAPWSGYQGEEELREKILGLSEDRRNFLRAPPQVSYCTLLPVAQDCQNFWREKIVSTEQIIPGGRL